MIRKSYRLSRQFPSVGDLLNSNWDSMDESIPEFIRDLDRLMQSHDELMRCLERYGGHASDCFASAQIVLGAEGHCNCGWDKIKERLAAI